MKQNPCLLNRLSDKTDYIEETECFFLGAIISLEIGRQVTARIPLTKRDEMQFIVAYHAWESKTIHKTLEKTGQDLKKLATSEFDIIKNTKSFGIKRETGRSIVNILSKNLGI